MKYKNFGLIILLLGTIALSACSPQATVDKDPNGAMPAKVSVDSFDISTWETYKSDEYGFTIKHPGEFRVYEGTRLKGTGSEYYSINLSKGAEYGQLSISPNTTHGSRIVMDPISYEQTIGGKKTFTEEWHNDQGGGSINLKFVEPIEKWKLCDDSEFCQHITFVGPEKTDFDTFKKMITTIGFDGQHFE